MALKGACGLYTLEDYPGIMAGYGIWPQVKGSFGR